MSQPDHYVTLGIERSASTDAIRQAYRRQARRLHPDVSREPDAEERFKQLSVAYITLRDPNRRAAYDRHMLKPGSGRPFTAPPDFSRGFSFDTGRNTRRGFSDLFDRVDSAPPVPPQNTLQPDTGATDERDQIEISIDLRDAYQGARRTVTLRRQVLDAHGQPQTQSRRVLVDIPKGIQAGELIKVPAQDNLDRDAYLIVRFHDTPDWRVNGKDVSMDLPVTPWEAMLGTVIPIQSPSETIDLTVPPGSQTGLRLRLKGRGIPASLPGDLYVRLRIVLPEAATPAARKAYQDFARATEFDPRRR